MVSYMSSNNERDIRINRGSLAAIMCGGAEAITVLGGATIVVYELIQEMNSSDLEVSNVLGGLALAGLGRSMGRLVEYSSHSDASLTISESIANSSSVGPEESTVVD